MIVPLPVTKINEPNQNLTTLQSVMWPDFDHYDDPRMAMRLSEGAALTISENTVDFPDDGVVSFDTAFNLFSFRKWHERCALSDLWLSLQGQGRVELSVFAVQLNRTVHQTILTRVVDLTVQTLVDLSGSLAGAEGGVLYFSLRAIGAAELHGAQWQTRQKPLRTPHLVLGITTFRREAAILATVAKFESFAASWPHSDHLHLIVVDNGQSASLPPSPKVTLVPNRNLGGAGGFARCLYEAQKIGASHVLFMDDDASINMLAIERTWAMLSFAKDPTTTVIGGLTQAKAPERIWENGAIIRQFCRPLFRDTYLPNFAAAVQMEVESSNPHPFNFYGGFWFFAFPIANVKHWPFPFFIRGDDINFSLSNSFNFVTLPGVVSFQDQDFADKESPMTLYLDLRNHLVQHLVLPKLDFGRLNFVFIPIHFFARSLIQNHMDSLLTLNLAIEDVMRGPAFFAANADLTHRRADITRLRRYERWEPLVGPPPKQRKWIDPYAWLPRTLMKLTMNGLFLPFFARWGNHLVMRRNERGYVRKCWGAGQISYVDAANNQIMHIRHEKLAMVRIGWRSLVNAVRLTFRYKAIKADWRAGYDGLTDEAFWKAQFFGDQE